MVAYKQLNATEKVVGGPLICYEPSDPNNDKKRSVLSLCIVSNDLLDFIDSLVIDEDMKFTSYRVLSTNKVVHMDHYTLLLKMKNLPVVSKFEKAAVEPASKWNTNKEGCWLTYENLTSDNNVLDSTLCISDDPAKVEKIIS